MGARRLTVIFAGIFVVLALTATPSAVFAQGNAAPHSLSAEQAREYYHRCAFPVAGAELGRETINEIITACSALINSEGGNSEARSIVHLQRGSMYRRLGKFDLALADFTMSIHYDPKSADAYTGRGNAHRGLHQIEELIADHSEAIKLDPKNASAYNNRGNAWRDKHDFKHAIADYDTAIELNPRYAAAFYNRGNTRLDAGDKKGAIADYRQALKLSPSLHQAAEMLKELKAKP